MSARLFHLNRVSLDGIVVRRLSAALRYEDGDRPSTRGSPWWAYLACELLPSRCRVGSQLHLEATLVSGRRFDGMAKIVERRDDAYGTTLILAGIEPLLSLS